MSTSVTSSYRRPRDHFEPTDLDPHEQRRLRGQLEQIDYTAFISNREVIPQVLGLGTRHADPSAFQKLAVASATARARWLAEALRMTQTGHTIRPDEARRLQELRLAFDELTEAYEGLRRVVERGYLPYRHTE